MQLRLHIWLCTIAAVLTLVFTASLTHASEETSVKHDLDRAADLFLQFEYENAEAVLQPLHENGVADATKLLAYIYSDSFGPRYDPEKALALFKQLSDAGDVDASLQLFDSEYWAGEAVSEAEAQALRSELVPALAREGDEVERVAHARLALACLFEEVACPETVPEPKHPGHRSSYGSEYNLINNVLKTSRDFLKFLESGNAEIPESELSQTDVILYDSLVFRAASRSDPYSAPLVLISKARKLLGVNCQSVEPFVHLAIEVLEHNDVWYRLAVHNDGESVDQLKSCVHKIPTRDKAFRRTYELVDELRSVEDFFELSIATLTILNAGFPAEQATNSYNNWCLKNAVTPDLPLCRAKTYTDDVFLCSRTTLSAFVRSIDIPDSSKSADLILSNREPGKFGVSKRYNACRQHFFEEARDSAH